MPTRFPDRRRIPAAHLQGAVRPSGGADQEVTEATMTYALEPTEIPLTRTSFTRRLAGWPRVVVGLAVVALFVPALARAQGDGRAILLEGADGRQRRARHLQHRKAATRTRSTPHTPYWATAISTRR
ncbi:MAG: hypothetical protein MZV65_53195 [Chromatiales bacterium]|nr:hypothetical protein [Chromatiales bacterium]